MTKEMQSVRDTKEARWLRLVPTFYLGWVLILAMTLPSNGNTASDRRNMVCGILLFLLLWVISQVRAHVFRQYPPEAPRTQRLLKSCKHATTIGELLFIVDMLWWIVTRWIVTQAGVAGG